MKKNEFSGLGCIILAAGRSSRLGQPKALVDVSGKPLIYWIFTRLSEVGLCPLVITRKELSREISESVQDADVIINNTPERGRTGSVKLGIRELKKRDEWLSRVMIVPVDRPGFSKSTIRMLMRAESSTCPSSQHRGGHPIVVDSVDIERILKSDSDVPLNNIIRPEKIIVDDPYLHVNIDTPRDLPDLNDIISELS